MHVPILRRQPALALQLQKRLVRDDRIRHVGASAITGNVLVLFDPRQLDLDEVRRSLERATATYARSRVDLRPAAIVEALGLRTLPAQRGGEFYRSLAAYGPPRIFIMAQRRRDECVMESGAPPVR